MIKYKGINKIYFGIGFRDDYATFNHKAFYFYWFKLIKEESPEWEMKRGRDYIGFYIIKRFKIPTIGINF